MKRELYPFPAVALALGAAAYWCGAWGSVLPTADAFVVSPLTTATRRSPLHHSTTTTSQQQQQRTSVVARFAATTNYTTNAPPPGMMIDLTPVAFGTTPDSLPLTTTTRDSTSTSDSSGLTLGGSVADAVVGETAMPLPLVQLALAGSITTLVSDIAMHPVDCIKTLQQSDAGIHLTFFSAVGQLWTDYGVAGFYFGFLTYALSDAVGGALKFSVWEGWKQSSRGFPLAESNMFVRWLYVWMGAALAFVASSVLIVPGELLKQQLQMNHYDDLLSAVNGIYAGAGLPGFFQGYEAVLYRDIPYTILELGLYDLFKSMIVSQKSADESPSVWQEISAGAVTGGITAVLTTPIDVVKTKMMVDAEYAGDSFVECFRASVDHHGWASVFSGVEARVAWILPFVAIYLPTYDFLKRQLYLRQQEANSSVREPL